MESIYFFLGRLVYWTDARFKIDFWRSVVCLLVANVCLSVWHVQATNGSISQVTLLRLCLFSSGRFVL